MSFSESTILLFFRFYRAGPHQMLFVHPGDGKLTTDELDSGMTSLIRRRYIRKERRLHAYSLTSAGYKKSLSAEMQTSSR